MKFRNITTLLSVIFTLFLFNACSSDNDEPKSSEKSILKFSINSVQGTISEIDKTIQLILPFGTDLTKLEPAIEVSPKANVAPSNAQSTNFTNPVQYTVTAEDGSWADYIVSVSVEKNNESSILSFQVFGRNGVINEETKQIVVNLPYGSNPKFGVPTVVLSPNATILPTLVVPRDFSKPFTYTVTAENGTEVKYIVTVVIDPIVISVTSIDENLLFQEGWISIEGVFAPSGNTMILKKDNVMFEMVVIRENSRELVSPIDIYFEPGDYQLIITSEGSRYESPTPITIKKRLPTALELKQEYFNPNDEITISGKYLLNDDYTVYLDDKLCATTVHSPAKLTFIVPADIEAGKKVLKLKGIKDVYYTVDAFVLNKITNITYEGAYLNLGDTFTIHGLFASSGNIVKLEERLHHELVYSMVSESKDKIVIRLDDVPNASSGGSKEIYYFKITSGGVNEISQSKYFIPILGL